jgi:hypothetical protein
MFGRIFFFKVSMAVSILLLSRVRLSAPMLSAIVGGKFLRSGAGEVLIGVVVDVETGMGDANPPTFSPAWEDTASGFAVGINDREPLYTTSPMHATSTRAVTPAGKGMYGVDAKMFRKNSINLKDGLGSEVILAFS